MIVAYRDSRMLSDPDWEYRLWSKEKPGTPTVVVEHDCGREVCNTVLQGLSTIRGTECASQRDDAARPHLVDGRSFVRFGRTADVGAFRVPGTRHEQHAGLLAEDRRIPRRCDGRLAPAADDGRGQFAREGSPQVSACPAARDRVRVEPIWIDLVVESERKHLAVEAVRVDRRAAIAAFEVQVRLRGLVEIDMAAVVQDVVQAQSTLERDRATRGARVVEVRRSRAGRDRASAGISVIRPLRCRAARPV